MHIHSLGFQDIREGVTLQKVTLHRLGCGRLLRFNEMCTRGVISVELPFRSIRVLYYVTNNVSRSY